MIVVFDLLFIFVLPLLVFALYRFLRSSNLFTAVVADEHGDEEVIVNLEQSRNAAERRAQQNRVAAKQQLDTADQILQTIKRTRK